MVNEPSGHHCVRTNPLTVYLGASCDVSVVWDKKNMK